MNKFIVENTKFDEVLLLTPRVFTDDRGYFCETYNHENLRDLGFLENLVQDNESKSKINVIRGLHYQWDKPMGKLVRVVKGSIIDVMVDFRKGSPTYGDHMKVLLSDENKKQIWIPPGFAHGILSLEDDTYVSYKCSSVYNQNGEGGINPFDEQINIDWGISKQDAVLSEKDFNAMSFIDYNKDPKFLYKEKNKNV